MSRRCVEAVEVRRGDEAPDQFLWRGRLYLVRAVLAHWMEAGGWWSSPAARPLFGGDDAAASAPAGELVVTAIPSSPKWGQRAWGEPAPDVGASVRAVAIDDGERECWRVEAAAGRSAETGVYELCFDWSVSGWTLTRILD